MTSWKSRIQTAAVLLALLCAAGRVGAGVHKDREALKAVADKLNKMEIAVAGDLRGHLIGTLSKDDGATAVVGAQVEVTGRTPAGDWRRLATTGENGFFRVDLDPASVGRISVTASSGEQSAKLELDSGDLSTGFTPRLSGTAKSRISLDGKWDFTVDPPERFLESADSLKWGSIKTPSHWEMEGFVSENGLGLYRKVFTLPAAWKGKRVKFRAEAIYSQCEIWVNGNRAGSHEGGATPFELDITDAAKPGEKNTVLILVRALSKSSDFDRMTFFAYFNLAGIWRPLEVFCVEPAHLSRLALKTEFDSAYRDAQLSVDANLINESADHVSNAALTFTLIDPRGKTVPVEGLSAKVSLEPWASKSMALGTKVKAPEQWNAEQPRLYKLIARLEAPGQPAQVIEQSVGFRQVEIKGRTFTINGRPVKLWGVSRLDATPLGGRVLPDEINRRDIEMMKQANFNALRQCVMPAHPLTLDLTDQMRMRMK